MPTQNVWPVNELGEIVLSQGVGSTTIAGFVNQDQLPTAFDASVPVVGAAQNSSSLAVEKLLLVGDSITAFMDEQQGVVSALVDNGDGTATATVASHNFAVGHPIRVNVALETKFNVFDGVVTAVGTSPTRVTYTLGGRTSPIVGSVVSDTQLMAPLRKSCIGWFSHLPYYLSSQVAYESFAAGGADSRQMLTLLKGNVSKVVACSDVVLCAGINDIYARRRDYATVVADMKALIDWLSLRQIRMVIVTPPPVNSTSSVWSATKRDIHLQLNQWLAQYGATVGAKVVDSWVSQQNATTYVNSAASNPDPTTGFTNATDGIHPTNVGAKAIARDVASALSPLVVKRKQAVHTTAQNYNNIFTNSSLTGTTGTVTQGTGTITGTAPTSYTLEITSGTVALTATSPARTVAADGDASGNNLQLVVSGAGTFRLLQSGLQASVTAGEKYRAVFPVKFTNMAALTAVELVVFGTKSAGGNENFGFVGAGSAVTGSEDGFIFTDIWTVPAGLTSLQVFLRFTTTTGGSGTILIGKPRFEKIIS